MNKKIFLFAQVLSFTAFLILLGCIIFGVVARDILAEGSIMLAIFWGQFTFIDIYIAFIVIFLWVVYRERSLPKSILWFFLIMFGGSMAICLYLFFAFRGCNNDMKNLLLGKRSGN
jgi:hypothetical protein